MGILGTQAHEALVAVLIMAREAESLSQRDVIARLPDWMRWRQPTLAKVEKGRRVLAFTEVQALAEIYGTDVATIEAQAKAFLAAKSHALTARPVAVRKPRRKR